MREIKVSKNSNVYATVHISHTGARVFYNLNHEVKERCFYDMEICSLDIINTLNNSSLQEEENSETLLRSLVGY